MKNASYLAWPYFLMLIVGLILPSDGNHGLLSPKSLAFLAACFSILCYFLLHQRLTLYQLKLILFSLCAGFFLLVWFIFGALSDGTPASSAFDQFKLFLITLTTGLMTLYLISENAVTPQQILRVVIYANFTYSLIKLSLVVLHLLQIINMWAVLEMMGIRFMSMLILQGIARLQTSVDIITPFLLFFVLQSRQLGLGLRRRFRWTYGIISVISIFLSFSRFLIMAGAFSFILYWITLSVTRISKRLLTLFLCCFAIAFMVGTDNLAKIFEQRFLSTDNWSSDQTRILQVNSLLNEFFQSPYIGIGMGGMAKDVIRDIDLQHSYEVQWVAFLMQFGIIGIAFIIVPLAFISKYFINASFSRINWSFFILFMLWLFSGFTNPFLISLTSGIVYSCFIAAGLILSSRGYVLPERQQAPAPL